MSRPSLGAYAALRWPLAPLLELTRKSPTGFCRAYGISGATMRRARAGGLTDRQADHWAIRAGYHPAQVWGPDWLIAAHLTEPAQDCPGRHPGPAEHSQPARRSRGNTAGPQVEAVA